MTHKQFQTTVLDYYKRHGRKFPWRLRSITPYQIMISEIMLQQTPVGRVIEKYSSFIKKFPSPDKLATASVAKIYNEWKGLGYNRRALALKKTARIIKKEYQGKIPNDQKKLEALPGIGPYTAAAIRVFAYNEPAILLETNIRSAYIFHFFKHQKDVSDKELIPLIEKTLYKKDPQKWYAALMDYGSMLKKEHGNISKRSKHHTKQSPFKGSRRETRGNILKRLNEVQTCTKNELKKMLSIPMRDITLMLAELEREGFIIKIKKGYKIC